MQNRVILLRSQVSYRLMMICPEMAYDSLEVRPITMPFVVDNQLSLYERDRFEGLESLPRHAKLIQITEHR